MGEYVIRRTSDNHPVCETVSQTINNHHYAPISWVFKNEKVKICFYHAHELGCFFQQKTIYLFNITIIFQFFSSGLPQEGEDNEGFDGFLIRDVLKEAQRAKKIVRQKNNELHYIYCLLELMANQYMVLSALIYLIV